MEKSIKTKRKKVACKQNAKARKRSTRVRGLSWAGYRRLHRRVLAGEMTWSQAESMGLCKPAAPIGRPRKELEVPK